MKSIQDMHFDSEISALRSKRRISTSNKLKNLNPFVDAAGLLRVGGRLSRSPLSFEEKHPIILPRIAEFIVKNAHLRSLHGDTQLTLRVIRQNF